MCCDAGKARECGRGLCDDKHFPTLWKHEGNGFLAMDFKSFYSEIQDTQVDFLHQDISVQQCGARKAFLQVLLPVHPK